MALNANATQRRRIPRAGKPRKGRSAPSGPECLHWIAALLCWLLLPGPAMADAVLTSGRLANPLLGEASGIAASRYKEDLLWVINDSGNGPYLYAIDKDGRDLGRVQVTGASNVDWEDLAAFDLAGRSYLLIADVGDNRQSIRQHTLYVVPEPRRTPLEEGAGLSIAWRIDFIYPDRPHDCEAVAVDAARKSVLLLTKRDKPPMIFSLPLRPADSKALSKARFLTTLENIPAPTRQDLKQRYGRYRSYPTALDVDSRGRAAVVLTYKDAYLFQRRPLQTWGSAFKQTPLTIRLPLPEEDPGLPQREALCFSRSGDSLFITSEGARARLLQISRPTGR